MIRWQPLFKFRVCVVDDCLGAARSCHVEGAALAATALTVTALTVTALTVIAPII